MIASMIVLASSLSLAGREPAEATDEPIDTQTVVSLDDYKHYDNCETPGECSAPCANPQIFHLRMCDSWMCNFCTSDYCAEECKGVQAEFPTCRCKDRLRSASTGRRSAPSSYVATPSRDSSRSTWMPA